MGVTLVLDQRQLADADLYQISLIRTGRPRQNPRVMEQAWPIVNHIAGDLKTTPRVSLSEIWY